MKKVMMLTVFLLLFGLAGPASAGSVTDTTIFTSSGTIAAEDYIGHGWGDVNWLSAPKLSSPFFDYVSWKHIFVPPPGLVSGTLDITFWDDEVDGPKWKVWTYEFGFGYGEDGTWDFGEVDAGTYHYDLNVAFLLDGTYTVKVKSVFGDFGITDSKLTLYFNDVPEPPNGVPEPSTLLLLGSGLLGIVAIGRKRTK